MRHRILHLLTATAIALSLMLGQAPVPAAANHADPHIGAAVGFPNPNSHNSTYSYYIEVCLASNMSGGPTWDAYGTGFNTQDRIRDAMAAWNALGGEAHFFASNNCSYFDTFILVSYDTYSNFGELSQNLWHFCGEPGAICWDKTTLHWDSTQNWYVGTGTPAAGQSDAQSMFTHELGHALYLGHSTNTAATMYGTQLGSNGTETWKRSLHGGPCDGSGEFSDVLGYKTSFTCDN